MMHCGGASRDGSAVTNLKMHKLVSVTPENGSLQQDGVDSLQEDVRGGLMEAVLHSQIIAGSGQKE